LQWDIKFLRAVPWMFLASACLEQSSDLAVRGAWPLLAVIGLAGAFAAGFATDALGVEAAFMRLNIDGLLVVAGAGSCASAELEMQAAKSRNVPNRAFMNVLPRLACGLKCPGDYEAWPPPIARGPISRPVMSGYKSGLPGRIRRVKQPSFVHPQIQNQARGCRQATPALIAIRTQ
jgi:hypothetical protein